MTFKIPDIIGFHEQGSPEFVPPSRLARFLSPKNESLFYTACEEITNGSFNRAEIILLRLLKSHPDFPDARFLLGTLKIKKEEWASAQSILLSLTGRSYFIGYWIFRCLPTFRLFMQAEPTFWLPILPRSEEVLIALAITRRNMGDETACFALTRKAWKKYPNNLGIRVFLASQMLKRGNYPDVLNLMNMNLIHRQDDTALLYRYLRGMAMVNSNDIRSGIYQMESALDFSGSASPYLRENVRFRIVEVMIEKQFYQEAIRHLESLDTSIATCIPPDCDTVKLKSELESKIEKYSERGLNVKINMRDTKRSSKHEEDFWEVN